ncbi:hypothetical protein H4R20_002279 [Coemansia guatemalensis]|uniref:Uncharacterized protein n=1 Tax=Coemansia guatemalensis TaxID=2761395 RepID=A0A9W8HVG2_9FUNG|nr:hypothetical protein H4R20_002279 [Coemansia guatemalensis]
MGKKQGSAAPLKHGSSCDTELSSSQSISTKSSFRDSGSSFVNNYRIDLDLGSDSSSSLNHVPPPADCPSMSLEELEERLQRLQTQAADTHAMIARYSRSSDPGFCPADNAKGDVGLVCCYGVDRPVPENALAEWRFDVCRWVRRDSPKPDVLLRRHNAGTRPRHSPLFDLSRPVMVHELLSKHAHEDHPIGPFMERHKSMEPFMPYVIQDAHRMPNLPQIAPVNDQATQHLPPLAAEEYAAQISRLSYLARSLQAIEAADPGFLSHTRVHLLLDLVMDLEQTFTLPRIDFLRRHAETIQAMGAHHAASETRDTDCIVGCVDNTKSQGSLSPPTSPDARHIKYMTRAIPRHPRFRRSYTANSRATNNRISSDHATSILGSKLQPDAWAASAVHERGYKSGMLSSARSPSPDSVLQSMLGLRQFDSTAQQQSQQQSQQPAAYVADASAFDPKLYPVVGPRSLEVSPTLADFARSKGVGPQNLHRRPQPGPELSPANSGEF